MKSLISIPFFGVCVLSFIGLVGCQTVPYQGQARDVKRKPRLEGVISIPTNYRPEDRAKADERMKSNCEPMPVKVLEEGEVVVGQETRTTGRESDRASTEYKAGSIFGIPVIGGEAGGKDTSSSSVTSAVKEWHISYQCDQHAKTKIR